MGFIGVVIPAYNREGVLGRALESVLAQTRQPDEIIVVDDGSSDGTSAVARSYGSFVRVIGQLHSGVSVARNTGVDSSSADFIAFLDSDDYWARDHLERMAN